MKTDMQILSLPNFDAELFEEEIKLHQKPKSKKKKKKKSRLHKIEEDPFNILIDNKKKETQAHKVAVSASQ